MAARTWTAAQKAKQAALIRTWKPWNSSTGPRTDKGKAISSLNGFHGYWRRLVQLHDWLEWEVKHTDKVTPELIEELKRRADLVLKV
jgi:hypothetical protein